MLCSTIVGLLILSWLLSGTDDPSFSHFILLHSKIIVGTAIPALLGAVVSVLAPLRDFEGNRDADLKLSFLNAFFKPYVGMVTGLFIVSALAVGIGQVGTDIKFVPPDEQGAAVLPDKAAAVPLTSAGCSP